MHRWRSWVCLGGRGKGDVGEGGRERAGERGREGERNGCLWHQVPSLCLVGGGVTEKGGEFSGAAGPGGGALGRAGPLWGAR